MEVNQSLPATAPGFFILGHFLADLSIENPVGRVPDEKAGELTLRQGVVVETAPVSGGEQDDHDVGITVQLFAALGERVIFLIEMTYRVRVRLQMVAPEEVPQLLHVQVPEALFPTLKEVIERNGAFAGYPELQLQNLDFAGTFARRQLH